jgi:hypothetical protein
MVSIVAKQDLQFYPSRNMESPTDQPYSAIGLPLGDCEGDSCWAASAENYKIVIKKDGKRSS